MTITPTVDGSRLLRRLAQFASIGATPGGGVNRQALSIEDRKARRLLADLAGARGFLVYQDAAANLFIQRPGRQPDLAPLLIGSHLDSQPGGGKYDGALGTLSAFEVLESLEDLGVTTERTVEVVAWTNEEGSRFSPGCMGSMAFVAESLPDEWHDMTGADGALFSSELSATLAALPDAELRPLGHAVSAYVELHIEQGPILERSGVAIGIVTAVQGTKWLDICFTGEAAHAGTTPLPYRRDPMAAAAQAMAALQASVMQDDALARLTVGRIAVEPGSINVIPREVRFTVDIRHPEADKLQAMLQVVNAHCAAAAEGQGCTVTLTERFDMPPGRFDEGVIEAISQACTRCGITSMPMVSGAFHDALFLARVAPSAMIFVPCRDGISHNEAEFVPDENVILGATALLHSTLLLSAACAPGQGFSQLWATDAGPC
jgi:beta-ureidopropionase / N-carbamoyl-L-amino-acid hydrolase